MLSLALGTGTQQGSQLTPDVFSISVLLTPVGPREVIYPWAILLYARMEVLWYGKTLSRSDAESAPGKK